jgi:hypothetical protein
MVLCSIPTFVSVIKPRLHFDICVREDVTQPELRNACWSYRRTDEAILICFISRHADASERDVEGNPQDVRHSRGGTEKNLVKPKVCERRSRENRGQFTRAGVRRGG